MDDIHLAHVFIVVKVSNPQKKAFTYTLSLQHNFNGSCGFLHSSMSVCPTEWVGEPNTSEEEKQEEQQLIRSSTDCQIIWIWFAMLFRLLTKNIVACR
jgi:hypothetical protein